MFQFKLLLYDIKAPLVSSRCRIFVSMAALFVALFNLQGCAATSADADHPQLKSIQQAVRTYSELRHIKGHFDGQTWNDDVDKWQGRKHRALIELADYINLSGINSRQLNSLFGQADQRLKKTQPHFQRLIRQTPELAEKAIERIVIYQWRGMHDYLYIAIRQDRGMSAHWWYSGE